MSENQSESSADRERAQSLLAAVNFLAILLAVPSWRREEMNAFAGAVSYPHVDPFGLLAKRVPISKSLPLVGPGFFAKAELAKLFLEQGNFAHMSPEQRREALSVAGLCAMPIYLPFMIAAADAGRNFRPDIIHGNAYSLDRMIRVQSEHWLTSRTAGHINPLEIPEVSAELSRGGSLSGRAGAAGTANGRANLFAWFRRRFHRTHGTARFPPRSGSSQTGCDLTAPRARPHRRSAIQASFGR